MPKTQGPSNAKIILLGETPSEQDQAVPFGGGSGQFLRQCLHEAGIDYSACFVLNVFSQRPPHNDIKHWLVGRKALPNGYDLPAFVRGKFLSPDYVPLLKECHAVLSTTSPNVIVALGGTALWALAGISKINDYRGSIVPSPWGKVLPTYSPGAVLRAYSNRVVLLSDLAKARLHSQTPDYIRPSRLILVEPTLAEIADFCEECLTASLLSVDVETKSGQITSVSFAPSPWRSIAIPLWNLEAPPGTNPSYWPDLASELQVWRLIRRVMESQVPKLFQNGLYDTQYFIRHGIKVNAPLHDTMIAQHALFPELPKSLGFLGSIHTDEPSWKIMRKQRQDTVKRDE